MKIPDGMKVVFQGKADYLREVAQVLEAGGVRTKTGGAGGGWEPRAWLAVASTDVQRAMELHRAHLEHMVARAYEHGKALNTASHFEIDDVIDPAESRRWIMSLLESVPPAPPRTGKKRPCVDTW